MSFSYDPTIPTDKDAVRLLIGDTVSTDVLLQDEEISFFLTREGSVDSAAAESAESIAAKFSRFADQKTGDISVQFSQRAKQYLDLADKIRRGLAIMGGVPFAGGISRSDKKAREEDTDRVAPAFVRDMHDHPATEQDSSFTRQP